MRNKFIISVFCLLFFNPDVYILSQDNKLDSLKTALELADESEKAFILARISLYEADEEIQYKYIQQALKLAERYNDLKAKSLALYSLSFYYLAEENYSKAEEIADSNITIALNTLESASIANAYFFKGYYYSIIADYNNSTVFYNKALTFYPNLSERRKYQIMENYAISLYNISNFRKALKFLLEVLKYYEHTGNIKSAAHVYSVIGGIYEELNDIESAKQYYTKAISAAKKTNYDFVLAETNLAFALILKEENVIDSVKKYLFDAKYYADLSRHPTIIVDVHTALGNLYLDINNTDSALFYYNEVIKLSEEKNDNWAIVYGYIGLAKVYNKEQNYGKSLFYLYKVEPIAQKVNANELLIDFYDIFSQTLALSGNYREAYHYMKLYNKFSDKYYQEKSAHELANLKIAYETEKKEQENKRLQEENRQKEKNIINQYYISVSITLLLIFALFFAVSFFKGKRKIQKAHKLLIEKNKEIVNQNEEIRTKSAEVSEAYEKLKELNEYKEGLTNMIIHDLKNPLNIILNMAENKLVKEAAYKMFHLVSDILDVSKLEEAKMVLNKEIFLLKEIVHNAINKTEFSAGISEIEVIDNVYDELSVYADKDLTERILINLLSNAIKFSPQKSKVFIDTKIPEAENKVHISVTDFGIGIPAEEQKHIFDKFVQFKAVNSATVRSTGLGLTFCKLAVEAQGGEIGVESSVNTGSVFWFELPLSNIN